MGSIVRAPSNILCHSACSNQVNLYIWDNGGGEVETTLSESSHLCKHLKLNVRLYPGNSGSCKSNQWHFPYGDTYLPGISQPWKQKVWQKTECLNNTQRQQWLQMSPDCNRFGCSAGILYKVCVSSQYSFFTIRLRLKVVSHRRIWLLENKARYRRCEIRASSVGIRPFRG